VRNNIVNGSSNFAYAIAKKPIDDVTGVVVAADGTEKSHADVPLKSFIGNQAYGNAGGVLGILSGLGSRGGPQVFTNLLAFANRAGASNSQEDRAAKREEWLSWWYPENIVIDGITLICDINRPRDTGIGSQTKLRQTTLIEPRIEGFEVGLMLPWYQGPNRIVGGYFNNLIDMKYSHGLVNKGVTTYIEGDVKFGRLPPQALAGRQQYKIAMDLERSHRDPDRRPFKLHRIYFDIDDEPNAWRLYDSLHQAADHVVAFGAQQGKSNQQLVDEGRPPVGGRLIPDNAQPRNDMLNVAAEAVSLP
jgi:hypothetical protein